MTFRKSAYAAVIATLASLGSASAFAGSPSAHKIDLGAVNGVAYYTEEAGSFRVVATLARGVPAKPRDQHHLHARGEEKQGDHARHHQHHFLIAFRHRARTGPRARPVGPSRARR